MKFLGFSLIAFFCLFTGCVTKPYENWNPIAYSITGCDGERVTILGTRHVLSRPVLLPKFLTEKIDEADVVFLELNNFHRHELERHLYSFISETKPNEKKAELLKNLRGGKDVFDKLSKKNQDIVLEHLRKLSVSPAQLYVLEPEKALSVILALPVKLYGKKINSSVKSGVDLAIENYAESKSLYLASLDDPKKLARKFADESEYTIDNLVSQAHMVVRVLNDTDSKQEELKFIRGDLDFKILREELLSETTGPYILNERESEWFHKIRGNRLKNVFAAVGYLHIVGEDNLLDRFRKIGCSVEKLNSQ